MNVCTFIHVIAISCSTAYLIWPIFYFLSQRYNPKGESIDPSHIWVNPTTGMKVRAATQHDVYIKTFGQGGWKIKIEKEKKAIVNSGVLLSLGIYALAAYLLVKSEYFNLDFIVILLFIGGVINFFMYFFIARYDWDVFWGIDSIKGKYVGTTFQPDLTDLIKSPTITEYFLVLFPIILGLLAVLLQIFFWLRAYRSSSLKLSYIIVFSLFFLGLTLLGFRKIKPYKSKPKPEKIQKPMSKAEAITTLITLLKVDSTFDTKELISKKLMELTGQNFGHDASEWEKWWRMMEPRK